MTLFKMKGDVFDADDNLICLFVNEHAMKCYNND